MKLRWSVKQGGINVETYTKSTCSQRNQQTPPKQQQQQPPPPNQTITSKQNQTQQTKQNNKTNKQQQKQQQQTNTNNKPTKTTTTNKHQQQTNKNQQQTNNNNNNDSLQNKTTKKRKSKNTTTKQKQNRNEISKPASKTFFLYSSLSRNHSRPRSSSSASFWLCNTSLHALLWGTRTPRNPILISLVSMTTPRPSGQPADVSATMCTRVSASAGTSVTNRTS